MEDGDPRMPAPRAAGGLDERGRGFVLIGALADAWGVRSLPDGKATWFVLERGSYSAGGTYALNMGGRRNDMTVVVARSSRTRGLAIACLLVFAVFLGAGKLGNFLPSLGNPFSSKTVDRTQPPLLQSLADLHEYHAAKANFQIIVDTEKDARFLPSIIKGERTTYEAVGSVDAIVDFSQLDDRSIQVSQDHKSVTILLPAPAVAEPVVDPEASKVASRKRGLLDRVGGVFSDNPTSEKELMLAAGVKMRDAAAASDLRAKAEENTRHMLEGMLGALGYSSVTVTFSPSPA